MSNDYDLKNAISNFDKRRILVLGDIALDHYLIGEVERINPEQPAAPLVRVNGHRYNLGAGGNVAQNLATLDAKATLCGLIGNDFYGGKVEEICRQYGISFIPVYNGDDRSTTVKQRLLAHQQQIARFDEEDTSPISEETGQMILDRIKPCIDESDAVILSDYNKGLLIESVVREVIKYAAQKGVKVYSEVKPTNAIFYQNSTLVCCNLSEAEQFTNLRLNGRADNIINIGREMMQRLSPEYLVITLSERGMFSYDSHHNHALEPTKAKSVVDVSGAGDTAISLLALANLELDIHASAYLANHGAGAAIEKVGTATITRDELLKSLS
ncbi:MAG: bifunctional ADP-heptose synthase [Candidatus Woesearchaeota archaeon]